MDKSNKDNINKVYIPGAQAVLAAEYDAGEMRNFKISDGAKTVLFTSAGEFVCVVSGGGEEVEASSVNVPELKDKARKTLGEILAPVSHAGYITRLDNDQRKTAGELNMVLAAA